MVTLDHLWVLEVRPRRMRIVAFTSAGIVIAGSLFGGATAGLASTGPRMTIPDQISIAGVGLMVAALILLLTRPRLRVGERGIALRNIFLERHFGWDAVRGVSFPETSPWARLELPGDEYLPIMALQARDGDAAVFALKTFRGLGRTYSQNRADDDVSAENSNS